ncbi:hypothetical protein NP233_g11089 [Leucocoprinus birnbaumii]|uniref:Hydrophobin n=1 Tax=Leucocoprinus birnbaumii TaxID=56174 RepID=A0AAD5VH31_9AGAR|nr:hypothetical protein NP233_g11089 [Leucocoprinus birnbaumii]
MQFPAAFVLALPAIAAATALPRQSGDCNTGSIQCCQSVQQATPQNVNLLQGLLGIVLGPIEGLIGPALLLTSLESAATPALLSPFAALATPSVVSLAWAATLLTSIYKGSERESPGSCSPYACACGYLIMSYHTIKKNVRVDFSRLLRNSLMMALSLESHVVTSSKLKLKALALASLPLVFWSRWSEPELLEAVQSQRSGRNRLQHRAAT